MVSDRYCAGAKPTPPIKFDFFSYSCEEEVEVVSESVGMDGDRDQIEANSESVTFECYVMAVGTSNK
jgi:hypothetical protein